MSANKILFINHFAGVPSINERSLRHFIFAKTANKNGYESIIITSQNHYHSINNIKYPTNKIVNIDGVNYIFIKEAVFKKNNLLTKFLKMTSFSLSLFIFFMFKKINIKNVKLVYSSSPDLFTSLVAYFIAKMKKALHYFEVRDIWPLSQQILHNFDKKNILIRILTNIELFLYQKSDLLISPLKNFNQYLLEKNVNTPFKFIPQSYFRFISNSKNELDIDLKSFSKIGVYAGTVGSFYKVEQLVRFFPNSLKTEIAVIIIGDGDKFEHLKDLIAQKDLNNFFIFPSKNHEELVNYFEISDFAFGFHPDYDELYKYGLCPLKTYDYMINKLPILFVGNKSYLDIVSDGIIACKFNNEKDFKDSLIKINTLTKQELREKGILNYNLVKINNSPESISKNFMEIISDI
tara:strand:- start:2667 stop:3884 length:1218 start_codon:yes stop_codon:yes gene_type:complete